MRVLGRPFRVVRERSGEHAILDCPACGKKAHCYVNLGSGCWDCKRCGAFGGWRAFREAAGIPDQHQRPPRAGGWGGPVSALRDLGGVRAAAATPRWGRKGASPQAQPVAGSTPEAAQAPAPRRPSQLDLRPGLAEECAARLWADDGAAVREYLLAGRRLPEPSIRAWDLGCLWVTIAGQRIPLLTIPVRDRAGAVVLMKYRTVPAPCPACGGAGGTGEHQSCGWDLCRAGRVDKRFMRSADCPSALYGAHRLPADQDAFVIVCEGELDVVAMDAYGYPAGVVSATTGAGSRWDDAALDLLEPYPGLWLAYDQDEAGDKGAALVAEALGARRCHRVRLPRKDAGDCWREEVPPEAVVAALDAAEPMADSGMARLGGYAEGLERRIATPNALTGLPTGSAGLNRCIGGLRPGLMIVTAGSGCGKTTLCTWLAYDQATRGVPAILFPFEHGPDPSFEKLVRMELGGDFRRFPSAARVGAYGRLDQLPLLMWRQHGAARFEEVLSALQFARRRHGVRFALLDHLEYLLEGVNPQYERNEVDRICRELAKVGRDDGVCICLVVHPSKINPSDRRRVMLTDAKLSSAVVQEAQCGLVLERLPQAKDDPRLRTRVNVDKLRSEAGGMPGSDCTLYFDFLAQRFADRPEDLPYAQGYPGSIQEPGAAGEPGYV